MSYKTENDAGFERQIAWEKWRDPYGKDIDDSDVPGLGKFMDAYEMGGEYGDYYDEEPYQPKPQVAVLQTPMGLVPLTEHTMAGKIFNFWTAHTNFRITREIVDIIDGTDGVETLCVYTPYRWRISIGKAFNGGEVKHRLTKNLSAKPLEIQE